MRISDWSSDVCSSDLDQIVQLHTFANNGSAHCGPVNGIIGANLHIVFNNHISNLAHLGIRTIRLRRKSKEIDANNRAGMNDEEGTNLATGINLNLRQQNGKLSDNPILPNITERKTLESQ